MRLSLHRGVWANALSLLLGGAGALTAAAATQATLQHIGQTGLAAGLVLFIWGIRIDGVRWWGWLRGIRAGPVAYMSVYEAVHYIADESAWGRRLRHASVSGGHMTLLNAPIEFEDKAGLDGSKVRVWGTFQHSAQTHLLPHTFWLSNVLDTYACFNPGSDGRTEPKVVFAGSNVVRYEHLKIDRNGVYKTWPKPAPFERVLLALREKYRGE